MLSQFDESIENRAGAEGEPNKCDRTHTKGTIEEDVSEDETGGSGTIECIGPRIINEIAELCEDYKKREDLGFNEMFEDGLRRVVHTDWPLQSAHEGSHDRSL